MHHHHMKVDTVRETLDDRLVSSGHHMEASLITRATSSISEILALGNTSERHMEASLIVGATPSISLQHVHHEFPRAEA